MLPVPRTTLAKAFISQTSGDRDEHDVGIPQRGLDRRAVSAQCLIQRSPECQHQRAEHSAKHEVDDDRVPDQRVGVFLAPPPSARAMAEEMPPPIAPADSICIIMKPGNTNAMPVNASRPSRETNQVSINPVEACASMTSTFGQAMPA
jgi:hypothetical protein